MVSGAVCCALKPVLMSAHNCQHDPDTLLIGAERRCRWSAEKRSPLSSDGRRDLVEIVDDRQARRPTIIISQFPIDAWHALIGDPTIADAMLDRLVHNAHRITLSGHSMRRKSLRELDDKA